MPGAGFYAIQASRIRFGRDGQWYADDERISNPRIAELFSRHLRREPDGRYAIRLAEEKAVVEVEDTPFVIVSVEILDDTVELTLNDGSRERLDPTSLRVGPDEVLYATVKEGAEPARFLRPAYYQLAEHFERSDGGFVLRLGNDTFPIQRHN